MTEDKDFSQYAHPDALVSTDWVAQHQDDPSVVLLESNEDVLLYEVGHIPGAQKIDWHTDLNDPVTRDFLGPEQFAAFAAAKGITPETTVVFYGDKSNWWAAYALWVFTLFGHADLRLMDGGRQKWAAEGRELVTEVQAPAAAEYPTPAQRDDFTFRAFREDVLAHFGKPMIDVRSPLEYSGERTHMEGYEQEGALRGGHIPSAASVPWAKAANEDGTFRSRAELEAIYTEQAGLGTAEEVIAYCRIGERSSHTWFVLQHLLGYDNVRNYDGSWTEWGNAVRLPIATGDQPGAVPGA
ncbi:sulfurtransferase [Nesterenkonia sp. E16_7]|uniref:sulfurtransferase n=1 Tax=unclassified Nesterenkonia TaxID=2629769 RepID=UPI001A923B49|nr:MULTISPECIES: sulfurtransferase [unclassified Nesterenkonia]MBO0596020.1 sulfurtransferase [Nesterenkonia sp. E16_10]MBO0599380.1 sulfurtransferase [Nesterenkonia sp. E16_7]